MLDKLVLWTFRESLFPSGDVVHSRPDRDGNSNKVRPFSPQPVVQTRTTHASLMAVAVVVTVGDLQILQQ